MSAPKFSIGDKVKVEFTGAIEGVDVSVTKMVWVWGVTFIVEGRDARFDYLTSEQKPGEMWNNANYKTMTGQRTLPEHRLQMLEPVAHEIAKVRK